VGAGTGDLADGTVGGLDDGIGSRSLWSDTGTLGTGVGEAEL